MLYFIVQTILIYHWVLIAAAVIPAIVLMVKVYRSDRLEKESPALLGNLVEAGILSALLAMVLETVGQWLLGKFVSPDDKLYNVIMFFVVVAVSEEGSKYYFMNRRVWNNREFNCSYDGVVYAVFTSLGFALWENISYVLSYGFGTALVRAVTAIPGHASFGVFMGAFYGAAKRAQMRGELQKANVLRFAGVLLAALMHGAYDYLATSETETGSLYFLIYVVLLFIASYRTVSVSSANDRYI